jgi:hypothetical protein
LAENSLFKIVLSKINEYKVNPQLFNGVRFEAYRFDTARKEWMFGKQFKDIYRNFNIRMSVQDSKLVYEFLNMDKSNDDETKSKRFDLAQLARIVD